MLLYPAIDPVALAIGPFTVAGHEFGPLQIHWYGIMYLLAFAFAWFIASRNSQRPWSPIKQSQVEDLIVYGAWGVILGGRFGYMMFYSADKWLADPAMILRIWEGGMSFHGGLLGVALALFLFARKLGIFRFSVEFVRQPDPQFSDQSPLFEVLGWMTRGQTLCIPMILVGLWFMRKTLARALGRSA